MNDSDVPVAGWEGLPKAAQLEVRRRIGRGQEVRGDPLEAYAGLCGALTTGAEGGRFCGRHAGQGVKERRGWGRCFQHEGVEEGLPPWFGVIPPETMKAIRQLHRKEQKVTHGGSPLMTQTIDQIFGKYLDGDEVAVMQLAMADPVQLLGVVMGVRTAGLLRVTRWLQNERVRNRGVITPAMMGAESSADKTATTIARLAEARRSYLELDQREQTHESIRGVLAGLSDEQFARLKSDPRAMAEISGLLGAGSQLH